MKIASLSQRLQAMDESLRSGSIDASASVVGSDSADHRIRVANDLESRRRAYELVYRLYLEKEYAKPHPSKMWYSLYDFLPDTVTLLAERVIDGAAVGALTVVFDSQLGLPADGLFGGELDALRASGRRLTEIVSLGIVGDSAAGGEVLVRLFNFAYLVARRVRQVTDFVITVNPRHVGFYRRKLLFVESGPERACDRVGGAPAVLCSIPLNTPDLLEDSDRHRTIYRLWIPASGEAATAAELGRALHPMGEAELGHFLSLRPELLAEATAERRAYLESVLSVAGAAAVAEEEAV